MTYNLKPTFQAIRYFETMTNTSFLDLEQNPTFVIHLLYCCLLAHPENNFHMTFDDAVKSFFPAIAPELMKDFDTEMQILSQFNYSSGEDSSRNDDISTDVSVNSSPKEKENVFLSSVIPILVMDCGLDINFVLNEMNYMDTDLYIKCSIEHKREQMESSRFWTYFNILPHVDSKKLKDPRDLVEFTWEKDLRKKEAEERMKKDRQRLIEVGIIKPDEELNKGENE